MQDTDLTQKYSLIKIKLVNSKLTWNFVDYWVYYEIRLKMLSNWYEKDYAVALSFRKTGRFIWQTHAMPAR